MAICDMDIVRKVRSVLAERIGSDRFELWFDKLARLEASPAEIVVVAQSPFVRDWIRKNLGRELRDAVQSVLSHAGNVEVSYTLMEPGTMPSEPSKADAHNGRHPAGQAASRAPRSPHLSQPVTQQPVVQPPGPKRYTRKFESFETFVVGEENRPAWRAARLAAERPGQTSPLLIYGPTATGKTHLVEAIRTELRREHTERRVLCLTAEQFTSGYVEAAQRRELPSFRAKYRFVDCLLLDNVHFLLGKSGTLGELLYTVDALSRAGSQIVMTSDRPPAELAGLGEELLSRVSAGLVAQLDPPGYEIRLGIARRAAKDLDLLLEPEILAATAMQVTSHCRAVIGAVNRLYAHSLMTGQSLTSEEAEKVLGEIAHHNTPSVRLPDIERAVCDLFGVDSKSLRSGRRARTVSDPRTLAMWLARKYTRAALGEIGTFFGRRSHSTVISAGRKVERWLTSHAQITMGNQNCTADEAIRRIEQALRRA